MVISRYSQKFEVFNKFRSRQCMYKSAQSTEIESSDVEIPAETLNFNDMCTQTHTNMHMT